MLGICSTIGKSHMKRSVFKHGHWAASRGLQSQGATTISILFRPKPWSMFLTTSLSFESAFCNIFAVQKGNASFEHIFNPRWGSVLLLRSHLWIGVLLNMATELSPGDCKAKGPQRYPYCFRPKPRSIFLTTSLSFESAFCNISDVQQGNASFEHICNPRWGSVVLLGSHIWIGMFLLSCLQGIAKPRSHNYIHTVSDQNHDVFFWPHLFHQRVPFVTFSMFRKGMHHLNIFSINVGDL